MRRVLRPLAAFGGCVILLAAATFGALQSPAAKRFLARELSKRLSGPDQTVLISTLSGWIPFELGVSELQILDAQGPWLTVRDVLLQWRPSALLRGRIHGEMFTARQVHLARLPTSRRSGEAPPDRRDWAVPHLPMPIVLDRLLLHQLAVEAPVTGMPLTAALDGSIAFRESDRTEDAVLKLVAQHAHRETLLSIRVTLGVEEPRLQVHLTLSEQENGWLATRLALKNFGTLHGKISALMNSTRDPPGIVWVDELEVKTRDATLTAQGGFHPATGSFQNASYHLSISDFTAISALTNFPVRGGGNLEGTVEGSLAHLHGILSAQADDVEVPRGRLSRTETRVEWALKPGASSPFPEASLSVQGKTSFLAPPGSSLPVLEEVSVKASASLRHDGTVDIETLRISSPALGEMTLQGWAHLQRRTADSHVLIHLSDLSPLSLLTPQPLKGDLRGDAAFSGSWDNMTVQTTLEGNLLGYGQAQWTDWHLALGVSGLPDNPKGRVTSRAAYGGGPFELALDFAKAGPDIHIPSLTFRCQDASVEGALKTHLEKAVASGSLRVSVPRLEILSPFLGKDIRGALEGTLGLAHEDSRQQLQGDLTLRSLAVGTMKVDRTNLSAKLETLSPSPRGMAVLNVQNIHTPRMTITAGNIALEGGLDSLTFSSHIEGTLEHPFSLDAAGAAHLDTDTKEMHVTALSGTTGPIVLGLEGPGHLTLHDRGWETSPIRFRVGSGRLEGRARWVGDNPQASLEIQDIALDLVRHFGGPPLEGRLNGRGTLRRVRGSPQAELNLKVEALRSPSWPPEETLSLQSTARADAGTLRLDVEVDGLGPESTRAGISVPIRFGVEPFELAFLGDKPMTGGASLAVSLERIGTLLALEVHKIQGLLTGQVALTGSVDHPEVTGTLSLDNGRYEHEDLGILLQDMTAVMDGHGPVLKLRQLKASDGKKGRIEGTGEIRLDPRARFPYEANLACTDLSPLHRDDISGNLNGTLSLHGRAEETSIKGALRVRPLRIRLPKRLPPNVVTVDVEEIGAGAPSPGRKSSPPAAPVPHRVLLDVSVNFPAMTTVSGWGLESEWEGALTVSGEASNPVVTGRMHILRGDLLFLTKRFRLAEGEVIFNGDVPPDPVLNVLGETVLRDMTAQVRVSGRASQPKLTIGSRPERPQDEVLAQILFGRSATTLSPFQALRLAAVLQSLSSGSGKGSGIDVLGKTRDLFGLEQLELLGLGVGEGLQVGLGKYLGENFRVDVNQRLEQGDVSLRVEVEVTPNITLETQVGTQSRTGAGVFWKYDY